MRKTNTFRGILLGLVGVVATTVMPVIPVSAFEYEVTGNHDGMPMTDDGRPKFMIDEIDLLHNNMTFSYVDDGQVGAEIESVAIAWYSSEEWVGTIDVSRLESVDEFDEIGRLMLGGLESWNEVGHDGNVIYYEPMYMDQTLVLGDPTGKWTYLVKFNDGGVGGVGATYWNSPMVDYADCLAEYRGLIDDSSITITEGVCRANTFEVDGTVRYESSISYYGNDGSDIGGDEGGDTGGDEGGGSESGVEEGGNEGGGSGSDGSEGGSESGDGGSEGGSGSGGSDGGDSEGGNSGGNNDEGGSNSDDVSNDGDEVGSNENGSSEGSDNGGGSVDGESTEGGDTNGGFMGDSNEGDNSDGESYSGERIQNVGIQNTKVKEDDWDGVMRSLGVNLASYTGNEVEILRRSESNGGGDMILANETSDSGREMDSNESVDDGNSEEENKSEVAEVPELGKNETEKGKVQWWMIVAMMGLGAGVVAWWLLPVLRKRKNKDDE